MSAEPEPSPSPPNCPSCRQAMKLIRTVPRLGAIPELHIFSCFSCGEVEMKETERA
jgi:hypothetical protein